MKASDLLVKCLEYEGVRYVFGIVGKETLDFVHSVTDSSIKFIVVRHEQAAAFMASVYGQLTNSPAVCTSTLGPGATNLATGIGAAFLDYRPVIAIGGQAGQERQHKTSHQYVNLVNFFKPITKWSVEIKDAKTIPEITRAVIKKALHEQPGPVYIDFPENIAKELVIEDMPIPVASEANVRSASADIQSAKHLIQRAVKPIIIVGNGAVRQDAKDAILRFAEKLQVPVGHTMMAKGVFPPEHPLNFYTFGFTERDYFVNTLRESDLVIAVGFDAVEAPPKNWNINKKPVLHIHSTYAEIDEYYPISFELLGNIKENLSMLNEENLNRKEWDDLHMKQERIKKGHGILNPLDQRPQPELLLSNIINTLQEVIPANTIVVSDVGANKFEAARILQPQQPNHVIISNGFASMGISLPGAIAAKLACPAQPVVCVTGDGGFLMNAAELETAKRLHTPIIVIVLNDEMYGLEKKMMQEKQSSEKGVNFTNPDFVKLAESFGIKGIRIENLEMLKESLQEEMTGNDIVLIDVPVKYS